MEDHDYYETIPLAKQDKIKKFHWREQWDEVADAIERQNTDIHNTEPSLTQQQFAEDVNLNTIVKRYGIGDGAIPPAAIDPQYFGDYTDAVDMRTALDMARDANERFNALPVEIRRRFDYDPVKLWDFVNRPENVEESVKLGLLRKEEPEAPKETPPTV